MSLLLMTWSLWTLTAVQAGTISFLFELIFNCSKRRRLKSRQELGQDEAKEKEKPTDVEFKFGDSVCYEFVSHSVFSFAYYFCFQSSRVMFRVRSSFFCLAQSRQCLWSLSLASSLSSLRLNRGTRRTIRQCVLFSKITVTNNLLCNNYWWLWCS